jgi:PIN domain nuclease of toxin-antitoxin system
MRILLDTHVLLWSLAHEHRLGQATRSLIEDPVTEVLFSAASIWEVAIKSRLGRASFQVKASEIAAAAVKTGFTELPVGSPAACLVAELPPHHRDPFDRLLVAQAMTEPAKLYTADKQLVAYSELVELIG